jgi:hypothetical protein
MVGARRRRRRRRRRRVRRDALREDRLRDEAAGDDRTGVDPQARVRRAEEHVERRVVRRVHVDAAWKMRNWLEWTPEPSAGAVKLCGPKSMSP